MAQECKSVVITDKAKISAMMDDGQIQVKKKFSNYSNNLGFVLYLPGPSRKGGLKYGDP